MNSNGASGHFQNQRKVSGNRDSAFQQVTSRNEKYASRQPNEPSSDGLIVSKVSEVVYSPIPVPVSNYYSANASRLLGFNSESSFQRYQAFSMSPSRPQHPNTAILQYTSQATEQVQQYYVPAQAPANMSAYQIHSPSSSLSQGAVMTSSPGFLHSPQQVAEETSRKRELRLLKNREAARECRRKKKEYVKCLENRVAVLENQNKTLIEELRALKDLLAAKACRRKRTQYVHDLESRIAALQVQNKQLLNELKYLKKDRAAKSR